MYLNDYKVANFPGADRFGCTFSFHAIFLGSYQLPSSLSGFSSEGLEEKAGT